MKPTTPREWENEIMPPRPRARALFQWLPDPGVMAMIVTGVAGAVSGHSWLLLLAIAIGVFALVHMALDNRYGVMCETADHWVGGGEMPEGMTQTCPFCREIPLRVLWRGGRR